MSDIKLTVTKKVVCIKELVLDLTDENDFLVKENGFIINKGEIYEYESDEVLDCFGIELIEVSDKQTLKTAIVSLEILEEYFEECN